MSPQNTAISTPLYFIDKFFVPAAAIDEFRERMSKNRTILKTLPGFLRDDAYSYKDANGNLICVTIAVWKDRDAIEKARQAVQAEYKKEGFDMPAMLSRLQITIDRGVYQAD
jgi:heme-degrading monooxygenase HmoA